MSLPKQEEILAQMQVSYDGPATFVAPDRTPKPLRLSLHCPKGLPLGAQVRAVIRNYGAFSRNEWHLDEVCVSKGSGRVSLLHGLPEVFDDLLAGGQLPGGGWLIGGEQNRIYLCAFAVEEPLSPGAQLDIHFRGTMSPFAWLEGSLELRVRLDKEAEFERVGEPQPIRSVAGEPDRVEVRVSPTPDAEGQVRATLFATDGRGNPVLRSPYTVSLSADGPLAGLPPEVSLDQGRIEIADLRPIPASGVARIHARVAGGEETVVSPAILSGTLEGWRVFFGALHFHTMISYDGDRDMSEAYAYARDYLNLDVLAAADHAPFGPNWEEMLRVNAAYYEPGRFVTLPAWECANFPGHVNVYLRTPDVDATPVRWNPALSPAVSDWPDDAIIVPHHVNIRGRERVPRGKFWWDAYDWSVRNKRMRLVEVVQGRGNFEADEIDPEWGIPTGGIGSSVQDALAKGFRVGFVGGTDNHLGYPTRGRALYCGMTGFLAAELTREAIWLAMENRRTYATSGMPIVCAFMVNDTLMGGEHTLSPGEGVRFSARLHGTAPIEVVEVISGRQCVWRDTPGTWDVILDDVSLPVPEGEWASYYLRLRQVDGYRAWASPVWVDRRG